MFVTASNFGRCSIKATDFNECIGRNIEDAIKKLKDGEFRIIQFYITFFDAYPLIKILFLIVICFLISLFKIF